MEPMVSSIAEIGGRFQGTTLQGDHEEKLAR